VKADIRADNLGADQASPASFGPARWEMGSARRRRGQRLKMRLRRVSVLGCRLSVVEAAEPATPSTTEHRQPTTREAQTSDNRQRGEAAEAHCCLKMPPERTGAVDVAGALMILTPLPSPTIVVPCPSPATCCGGGITGAMVVVVAACSCSQATPARVRPARTSIRIGRALIDDGTFADHVIPFASRFRLP